MPQGTSNESSSLLGTGKEERDAIARQGTIVKALLYAVQVFYSFFIMYGAIEQFRDAELNVV